jgi:hypothetical protein
MWPPIAYTATMTLSMMKFQDKAVDDVPVI